MLQNPFSITKATEFTDIEINDYWINFSFGDDKTVFNMLNPNEFMPKYILGGKGCGKTHLLRYFSFPLQMIRYNNDPSRILSEDKYIGIYSVLDGLDSSRFAGKGIDDNIWNNLFEYYFELYICDNLLNIINNIFSKISIDKSNETEIVNDIKDLFHNNVDCIHDFPSIIEYLKTLRRNIDSEIVNAPFTRKLNFDLVKISFSPGDLIFGIPKILSNVIKDFKKIKFIYILDEYEKFYKSQKIFVNSLVFDKKTPCTFWIGSRKYGFSTQNTKSDEPIRPGSEFQPIELDAYYRRNETHYRDFAKNLFINRLVKFYEEKNLKLDKNEVEKRFIEKFVKYTDETIINKLKEKYPSGNYPHIKNLKKSLESGFKKKCVYGVIERDSLDYIVESLKQLTNNNPLYQKYKIFLFYQKWNKANTTSNLLNFVDEINSQFNLFLAEKPSVFDKIQEKFKLDFIVQLASENKLRNTYYSGIDNFIDLSWGNPRVLLLILKITIEKSWLRGENPLSDGSMISLESQFQGVFETAKWFFEDAEIIGVRGKNIYKSIYNLADLFRLYRFSDKPPETSVSCFSYRQELLSEQAEDYISESVLHSLIIEIESGRKEKNSGRKEKVYQINKTIAPLWNLPTSRRGIVSLNKEILESIFNPEFHDKFNSLLKRKKNTLNAPFCSIINSNSQTTLFDT
ncbi:MAG: hypothetical protein KAS53_05170 [Candidatus Cloacimonetes bacterium]|nr:hypothetical protein [Candidatus Cloacimonadota bacterium]